MVLTRPGNGTRGPGEETLLVGRGLVPAAPPTEARKRYEAAHGSQNHETTNCRHSHPENEHDSQNEDEAGGAFDWNLLDPDAGVGIQWFVR